MKMLRIAAVALLFTAAPAYAQWQTPNHSVPVGKGGGGTGFSAAAPGVAGRPLVSTGAATDPQFGTIANSGFTPGAADTYKGSLNGSSVADVAMPDCQTVSTALRYVAGSGPVCGNILVQTGMDMPINLGLSSSAVGGALTINVTQANGSAPSSSSPVLVPFRSTTAASGTVTWRTISSSLTLTIPSGATLGTANSVPSRVWLFLNNNNGTPAIGVATCSNPTTVFACSGWESTLVTSTTIGGASNTAGTLYAAAGVTLDAVRIVGYCEFPAGMTTAGTWTSACTIMQLMGPGVKKPGDVVQLASGTAASTASLGAGGTSIISRAIAPQSAVNLIEAQAVGAVSQTGASTAQMLIGRGSFAQVVGPSFNISGGATQTQGANLSGIDAPGVITSTTYSLYGAGTSGTNAATGTQSIVLKEIMG